ncbi:RES family NAD+ phosphorylase [Mesorhizobium sp. A556]
MPRLCCPDCFDDRGLRHDIIPSLNPIIGDCDFCGSLAVALVEPHLLRDVFELLISVYEPNPAGKTLVEWMKEDWQLFTHPQLDVAHAKELLGEILDDGQIVRQTFAPSADYQSEALARWETLCDELMYRNRYFLDEALDTDRLEELLVFLPTDNMPETWYRARILAEDAPYTIAEMGAPPKRLATYGRANPPGIPYLYLGSIPETAAAEVRPHTGEVACVAAFTITGPLRAVDLRNPRKLVSPFLLGGASAIGQLRADIAFLERLGDELTRPVLPRGAAIDYIPSQYLCEFIKKKGYDGVVYRSSVSNGMNLALFAPDKAVGGGITLYTTRVSVEVDAV